MFTNHNKENNPAQITSKGKEHEDESKPIFTSQSQVIVLKLYQNCSEQEERASGMRGKERRREDWDQAEADKLGFTLVNKQGG